MDTISPDQRSSESKPSKKSFSLNQSTTRKIIFYAVLVILGAGAAYAIVTNPTTGWIPAVAYIVLASITVAYRKVLIEGKSAAAKVTQDTAKSSTDAHMDIATPKEEIKSPEAHNPKRKLNKKHVWAIVGVSVGALIVLLIAVAIFQPKIYFWLITSQGQASHEKTSTHVDVLQTLTLKQPDANGVSGGTATQSISLDTETQHVAPDSWSFMTQAQNSAQKLSDGVDAIIVDGTAYQRRTGSNTDYSSYTFASGEYDTTKQAIESSSLFQSNLLHYAGTPRFVFNTEGQPWWLLHYRMPINVDAIIADSPDWYSSDLYAFGKDPTLTKQTVDFTMDIWVNPFTRKVVHEKWLVVKTSADDAKYDVRLDIQLDRSLEYPKTLSISVPTNVTASQPTTTDQNGSASDQTDTPTNQ